MWRRMPGDARMRRVDFRRLIADCGKGGDLITCLREIELVPERDVHVEHQVGSAAAGRFPGVMRVLYGERVCSSGLQIAHAR